jgi:8-oxo-dGTP diphosphatase
MQIRSSVQALIIRDEHLLTIVKQYPEGVVHILPGGGQEFGETLSKAVKRECLEELGAEVQVEGLVSVREFISKNHTSSLEDDAEHLVNHIFACTLLSEPDVPSSPDIEQIGIRWLPLVELEHYRFYPRFIISLLKSRQPLPFYLGDVN